MENSGRSGRNEAWRRCRDQIMVSQPAQAAVPNTMAECLSNRNVISHHPQNLKSNIRMLAWPRSGESPPRGLPMATCSLCAHVDLALCLLGYEPPLWALLTLASSSQPYLHIHWGLGLQNMISRAGNLVPSKCRALRATKQFFSFVLPCLKNVLHAFLCGNDLLKFWKTTLFTDWVKGEDQVLAEEIEVFQDRRREKLLRFNGAVCAENHGCESRLYLSDMMLWGNYCLRYVLGFPSSSAGKEPACNAGDPSSRSPGKGKGKPFQYSGLENSMDCVVFVFSCIICISFFICKIKIIMEHPP